MPSEIPHERLRCFGYSVSSMVGTIYPRTDTSRRAHADTKECAACNPYSITRDETDVRGHKRAIPNLNVLFEFGFFYSALGKEKVAVVRYGDIYLPSDLDGYIHITGSKHFTRGRAVSVGKLTKTEFDRWLHPHGRASVIHEVKRQVVNRPRRTPRPGSWMDWRR